jgi:Flp pilus assembly protein TadG
VRRSRGDAGSVTVEVVIITPVAIALMCLVAFVGRTSTAREQVDEAARDAARSASLERDPWSAHAAAETSATTSLTAGGFNCAATQVDVDTTAFYPGGQVSVTVRCDIPLSDLGLIGLAGTRSVQSRSVSVVDVYRGAR